MGGLKREGARSEGQDFIKVHYQPDGQKHASRGAAAVCPSRTILAPDQAGRAGHRVALYNASLAVS